MTPRECASQGDCSGSDSTSTLQLVARSTERSSAPGVDAAAAQFCPNPGVARAAPGS
jgi:hypothetical protein